MTHIETTWKTTDGAQLYAQIWEPDTPALAAVCLVHGLGDHGGRYGYVAERLNRAGIALLTHDLRGHGRSTGRRGHINSLETYWQDIQLLLAQASQRYPKRPLFLYGNSLGGLLVLNYLLRRRPSLSGAIVTSPGLQTPLTHQKFKVALARLLSSVWPTLTLPSGLDVRGLSRDPAVVQKYQSDPLVHDRITTRSGKCTLDAIAYAFEHAAELHLPLLIMHGSADAITFSSGGEEFTRLARAAGGQVSLRVYEGLYHELHNEPERDQVLDDMVAWITSRIASTGLNAGL